MKIVGVVGIIVGHIIPTHQEYLGAQYAYRYPTLIGLSVMDECEGISTPLSVLLSRFKVLPRASYNDNGCNMLNYVAIRTPCVNEKCLIVSDRFHYRSHKCDIVTDPDSYSLCTTHGMSSSESINKEWKFIKSHVRFLASHNSMPSSSIRAVFKNIAAWIREKNKTQEIEESHYRRFANNFYTCSCILSKNRNELLTVRTRPYMNFNMTMTTLEIFSVMHT